MNDTSKWTKIKGFFSINDLPKTKDRAYIINFDEYKSIGIHWIALYVNGDNVKYPDTFGDVNILKQIKKIIGNKKLYQTFADCKHTINTMCIDQDLLLMHWNFSLCAKK